MKLSAFGQALPDGHDLALELVRPVVEAATAMGTTVTLDMEDHRTVDSTLAVLAELRKEHPDTGAVLQAMLFRTEDDAKALAVTGSRVRLVKGAYNEPADRGPPEEEGRRRRVPAVPGDPDGRARLPDGRLARPGADRAGARARGAELARAPTPGRSRCSTGSGPTEQRRLAAAGTRVRAYVPYGVDWYAYFMRRLAERPANVRFFLRSLVTRS